MAIKEPDLDLEKKEQVSWKYSAGTTAVFHGFESAWLLEAGQYYQTRNDETASKESRSHGPYQGAEGPGVSRVIENVQLLVI